MSESKEAARLSAKKSRRVMTAEERAAKSAAILGRLLGSEEYRKCRRVMVYVSKPEEVDTLGFITAALRDGKEVVVPKVEKGTRTLIPCVIGDLAELSEGEFSVLEPRDARRVDGKSIDLFIVPGLAFCERGNRIGYGRGYWDRFLAGVGKGHIVGLAFENQILREVDKEIHDVPVSAIVTEKRVILC